MTRCPPLVKEARIPGAEKAILGEALRGGLFLAEITLEDLGSFHQDLPLLADAHLRVGERGTHGFRRGIPGGVGGGGGGGFRLAVDLADVQA